MDIKKCLTAAGSDSSGGAGIQADLKTFAAHGCYGASVVTAVVAENTRRVISVFSLPAVEVANQFDAVFGDIEIDAVKLGMLPNAEIIRVVGEKLSEYKPKFSVCDPVLSSTSGTALSEENSLDAYKKFIFPNVSLITPNIPEAERFCGFEIHGVPDMEKAALKLSEYGAEAVLVKGGHLAGDAVDVLFDGEKIVKFTSKRINSENTHGTGCTLSSAIAANCANGMELSQAVNSAKNYLTQAIENSYKVGQGKSPVNHFYQYTKEI